MIDKNIVIVNAHWSNRGDEAALRAIIDELLRKYKRCKIEVIFKDDRVVTQFPYSNVTAFSSKFLPSGFWSLRRAVLKRGKCKEGYNDKMMESIRKIAEADVLVYSPGGAVICSRFWWKKQLEYLLPFICAKIYRIPMVVAAPSIGPFDGGENNYFRNKIIRNLLKRVEVLCVREDISRRYLAEIGVNNVISTIDTAFYDMPDIDKNQKIFEEYKELCNFLESYDKVIGMTLSDFSWHVKLSNNETLGEKVHSSMNKFMDVMTQERGVGILLIPQLFGNQNDYHYLEKYKRNNIFILSDEVDTYFQQYVISKLYAVIGMRYHSNIFAAKMGTPFLAIAYEEKMTGFMEKWNLQKYLIDLHELSFHTLEKKWVLLETEYREYQNKLNAYREQWKNEANHTLELVTGVIDNMLESELAHS